MDSEEASEVALTAPGDTESAGHSAIFMQCCIIYDNNRNHAPILDVTIL